MRHMIKLKVFQLMLLLAGTANAFQNDEFADLGGSLIKPEGHKGHILFVNSQRSIPLNIIKEQASYIEHELKFHIIITNGEFSIPPKPFESEAALFIIESREYPTLLSAPEDGWAMVNFSKIKDVNTSCYYNRARKELLRGFLMLGGAFNSQFPHPLVRCVTNAKQLDDIKTCEFPYDALDRMEEYLKGYGISTYKLCSYVEACNEGWAPQPTNDVQKAIWDRVYTPPSKPIKITYDKDKQKPVVK